MNDLLLQRSPPGPERERYLPLLLLADESEQQVRSYMNQGELYVWLEGERLLGIVLTIPRADDTLELKAVAVVPAAQSQGLGQRMVNALLDHLRRRKVRHVVVGTASSAIGPLAFYQKVGFRLVSIERDYFRSDLGYRPDMRENGIAVRDMVWMDQWL